MERCSVQLDPINHREEIGTSFTTRSSPMSFVVSSNRGFLAEIGMPLKQQSNSRLARSYQESSQTAGRYLSSKSGCDGTSLGNWSRFCSLIMNEETDRPSQGPFMSKKNLIISTALTVTSVMEKTRSGSLGGRGYSIWKSDAPRWTVSPPNSWWQSLYCP